MAPRAPAMAPEDRRRAIVQAVIPLLVARGGDVTTKEMARAAGIAEGTIFRVFPDKAALLMAAAQEAMNPSGGAEAFDAVMAETPDLRDRVMLVTARVQERMRLTMAVLVAVRPHLAAKFHEAHVKGEAQPGPPPFVVQAHLDLHERLTRLFEPYAAQLAVDPPTAALALRSLVFGSARPEFGMEPTMTPDQIADVLLDGVRTRPDPREN